MKMLSGLEQAFSPGADLWIVGQPESSAWALQIDWNLNFQILRGTRHVKPPLAPPLMQTLNQAGLLPLAAFESDLALLVAADLSFPCRWVVSVPHWQVTEIYRTWKNLEKPALRVFFPKGHSHLQFERDWQKLEPNSSFEIVLD